MGSHPEITAFYVAHPAARRIAEDIGRARWRRWAPLRVMAFWCNAGEHRSVAMADSYHAAAEGATVFHLCRHQWHYRGCGGCAACDPARANPQRERAWEEFRWMLTPGAL